MKILVICSKHFYDKIPLIKKELENLNHRVTLPNSFERPFAEEEMKEIGKEDHAKWKQDMMKKHKEIISPQDAILVLNLDKNNQKNYIGGATFMEIVKAWELGKRIFIYNEIPENILTDEITAMQPQIINGDLTLIK